MCSLTREKEEEKPAASYVASRLLKLMHLIQQLVMDKDKSVVVLPFHVKKIGFIMPQRRRSGVGTNPTNNDARGPGVPSLYTIVGRFFREHTQILEGWSKILEDVLGGLFNGGTSEWKSTNDNTEDATTDVDKIPKLEGRVGDGRHATVCFGVEPLSVLLLMEWSQYKGKIAHPRGLWHSDSALLGDQNS